MAFSEHNVGFSTGALAKGDFRRGLALLRAARVTVVELSALRESELPDLMSSLGQLDLRGFSYVSVHIPTKLEELSEQRVLDLLKPAVDRKLPIVVHPDVIETPDLWRSLDNLFLVENMDKRKPSGRTVAELIGIFENFPEAGFCFDVAHAAQVDPTMTEAAQMLRQFGLRIRQVHASGVSTTSGHNRLSAAASFSISRISHLFPKTVPIILESPVDEHSIESEIQFARNAFDPWLERLRADIDGLFDLQTRALRRSQITNFLRLLETSVTNLSDFDRVIGQLPSGGPYKPGDVFLTATDLLNRLSEPEKKQLRMYLIDRMRQVIAEFPDLKTEFKRQLAELDPSRLD